LFINFANAKGMKYIMSEKKSVFETIKENYEQMFAAEKKVADFILQNPEKAVNANVSELANYSQVSDATIIRMCKHIGYQGYYQMRIYLSHDLGRKQADTGDMIMEETSGTLKELFSRIASNIFGISDYINIENLQACADLINSCNTVHLVAVGNTSPLIMDMGFRLGRLGIRATYNTISEYFFNHINLAKEGDIVIVVSHSGTSKQVVQAMELAKEKKLKIIAITGSEYSPVSNLADHLLLSKENKPLFEDYGKNSHLNEMAVIDALLYYVSNGNMQLDTDIDAPEVMLAEYKL
jgi:RpiR family transcriptional regulator, carbohydrate utilization regulator